MHLKRKKSSTVKLKEDVTISNFIYLISVQAVKMLFCIFITDKASNDSVLALL